jgi:hypothetical protein
LTPVSHCLERIASGRYKPWFRRSESSPWHSVASVAQDGGKHSNWDLKSWLVILFLSISLSLSSACILLDPCKCNTTAPVPRHMTRSWSRISLSLLRNLELPVSVQGSSPTDRPGHQADALARYHQVEQVSRQSRRHRPS